VAEPNNNPLFDQLLNEVKTSSGAPTPAIPTPTLQRDNKGVLATYLEQSMVADAGRQAAVEVGGATTRGTPVSTGEIFSTAATAGTLQLEAMGNQFMAIPSLIKGNQEDAETRLNKAKLQEEASSSMLESIGSFSNFLDEPTYEGFYDQVIKSIGQFTPMALSSVASGFTGAAVQVVGKGVIGATSKKVTREVITDILKKENNFKRGIGDALDANEQAILNSAYATVKKAGQYPNMVNAARTASPKGPGASLQYGFWAGAGGQEYVVGSAQALSEYSEAGYKLTDEEAKTALALGIPQAIIGTLSEKLFVGALFKKMASKATKTGDADASRFMVEMAKGLGGGFAVGATTEGLTELAQEELFIKQRQAIDPTYSDTEANLRRAESAFAGFFAGGAARGPATAAASVIGEARRLTEAGMPFQEEAEIAAKKGGYGRVIPEPKEWTASQINALLDPGTKTSAVWLPTDGFDQGQIEALANDVIEDLGNTKGISPEQLARIQLVVDPEGSGIMILDSNNPLYKDHTEGAAESGFSEEYLRQTLGYTELQDASHDVVVEVTNKAGHVVWSQSTSAANKDKVVAEARKRFPDKEKYPSIKPEAKEVAVSKRVEANQAEDVKVRDMTDEDGEVTFDEDVTSEEQEARNTSGMNVVESTAEQSLLNPLTRQQQKGRTETEVQQGQLDQKQMRFEAKKPDETQGMDDERANQVLDTRAENEKFFLEYNSVQDTPGIRGVLDQLSYQFLNAYRRAARSNPAAIVTARKNSDGTWGMVAEPKDALPSNNPPITSGRIEAVMMESAGQSPAVKNKTPGWSVQDSSGAVRNVYMGNLVNLGISMSQMNEGSPFTTDSGRIAEGFNLAIEALDKIGSTLLYNGIPATNFLNQNIGTLYEGANMLDAPIYESGGAPITLRQAQEGRSEIQNPADPTDAVLQQELNQLEAKHQKEIADAFEEFYNNPNRDPEAKFYPPDVLDQTEVNRKRDLERQLNKGLQDPSDFVDTTDPNNQMEGDFQQTSLDIDNDPTAIPLSRIELEAQATVTDPFSRKVLKPLKPTQVEIGQDWNNIMGGLKPQLTKIITEQFKYGRNLKIHTAQNILQNGLNVDKKISVGDAEVSVNDVVKAQVQDMIDNNKLGRYISFADTDVVVINIPENATQEQLAKGVLTLGHELGHVLFNNELNASLDKKAVKDRLMKAFEADKKRLAEAGGTNVYENSELGFEEWFSDQMGTWLLREAKKPTNAVESFFKRLADKLRAVFQSLSQVMQARFRQNPDFNDYVTDTVKAYKDGLLSNDLTYEHQVTIRDMVDEAAKGFKEFMPKKAVQQIKRKVVDALQVKEELMPNDKRHWSVGYFLQPAHNYLKQFSSELAGVFYSPSQSTQKPGHLNARVLLTYQRLNELWALAPTKQTITGKTVPDLDAFETVLQQAEQDVDISTLPAEAQKVRRYLDNFYETYVRGIDDTVFKRKNFYPRILALAELQASPDMQSQLVALLTEFNPEGPGESKSFTKIVETLISEQEDNPDNVKNDVADVAIGMNEERAQFFKKIPNERLRQIGALESANTSIRKYVEDMTKKLDYKEKSKTILTKADRDNVAKQSVNLRNAFKGKKVGDTVNGWMATEIMLLRIPDEKNRGAARDAVKAMLGKTGLNMSPAMRQISSGLLALNVMTYLTFATLASLPDLAGPVLRSKDLSIENLRTGVKQIGKYFNDTKEAQQFARDVGVISFDSINTSVMQANELGFMTPKAQQYSDLFFRAIGLEWYTNFTRTFAAGMGEQFLIRQASETSDRSTRFLDELQVSKEDVKYWVNNRRDFNSPQGARVKAALGRFVEESIVRPNAAERPVWASNPYTALVWQLKSFFYAYGKNIVGGSMRESKNRYAEDGTISSGAVPLTLAALTLLPLTMVGLEMREWLKYLGRGFDEKSFRTDNMDWGTYSKEIIDRSGVLGPYGLILPMLEAGRFNNSFITPALGPSAERVEDLVRGNAKLSDYLPGVAAIR